MLGLFVSMPAYFLAQTLYFQIGLGWSVLKSGLVGVPFAVVTSVCAGVGVTVLAQRIGRRVLQYGAVVLAAGVLLTGVVVHAATPETSWWWFIPAMVVTGAGFGLMVAPIGLFTVADVPVSHAGAASGLFNTTTQLSAAVGVAGLGTLFFTVAQRQGRVLPVDVFAPAYEVVLLAVAACMALAVLAAAALPHHAPGDAPVVH